MGSAGGGAAGHGGIRVYKYRGTDALGLEGAAQLCEQFLIFHGVPAGVGGEGVVTVRHQGHLVRHHFQHQVYKTGYGGIAFNIEFRLQEGTDGPYVGIADVALVGPGMYGYALGPEGLAIEGSLGYIRHVSTPGIADGSYLIYIDAESSHFLFCFYVPQK